MYSLCLEHNMNYLKNDTEKSVGETVLDQRIKGLYLNLNLVTGFCAQFFKPRFLMWDEENVYLVELF